MTGQDRSRKKSPTPEEAWRAADFAASFRAALELEPDHARFLCNLGWGCLAAGRLEERAEGGDAAALDRFVREHNRDRFEAWRLMLCRERRPAGYPEVSKSLRALFDFADRIDRLSAPSPALYEDLDLMTARFPILMDRLLVDMDDVDEEILEEIYAGLFSFYGFLAEHGLVEREAFDDFRSEALAEKARLLETITGGG